MLRTGTEHLESLRDGRVVYVGSERVEDVTRHPAFCHAAATVAAIYDMKADPANRDTMSYEEDGGTRVAQVDRAGCALILSDQWPEKVGKGLVFISLNVEPATGSFHAQRAHWGRLCRSPGRDHGGGQRRENDGGRCRCKGRGIRRRHSKQQSAHEAGAGDSRRKTDENANGGITEALADDHRDHLRTSGADRDTHGDFPLPLTDDIRHHAVHTDECQHERERGKATEHERDESRLRDRIGQEFVHRSQAVHR